MSDGEAFAKNLALIVCFIILAILLFIKTLKNNGSQCQDGIIDTITVIDTVYQTDTVTVWKQSKPDTVYIIKNDTI